MVLKQLTRLYVMKIQNNGQIWRSPSIFNHIIISDLFSNCFLTSKYQFSKLTNNMCCHKTHTKVVSCTEKLKNAHSSFELGTYDKIWYNSIQESELQANKEKFHDFIRLLEKSDEEKVITFLQNSNINHEHLALIIEYRDKIFEIAVFLKCSPFEAFKAILKHHFLLHSKITTLQKKMDVVIGSGITLSDLRKDLWVLSYTVDKLQARIDKVKKLNLPIKSWMLRCKETTLDRSWENREKNKAAMLPFTNSREYLCNRLEMNDSQLTSFSSRHPAVLKVKTAKLRKVLDYLLSEGFSAAQIYSTPRILCHSISTIKARLCKLRDRDCKPRTLSLLCISTKAFETYLQKLDKPVQNDEKNMT